MLLLRERLPRNTATVVRPVSAPTVFLFTKNVMDAFAEKLATKVRSLKVGHGLEPGGQIGPLIDAGGLAKVNALVQDALAQGAIVVTGGKPDPRGGLYYRPTVIKGVTRKMRMMQEEIFGPVAPLFEFSSEDEAIRLANDTEFGLASSFLYPRPGSYFPCFGIPRIRHGWHQYRHHVSEVAPFGGVKQSGFGREECNMAWISI